MLHQCCEFVVIRRHFFRIDLSLGFSCTLHQICYCKNYHHELGSKWLGHLFASLSFKLPWHSPCLLLLSLTASIVVIGGGILRRRLLIILASGACCLQTTITILEAIQPASAASGRVEFMALGWNDGSPHRDYSVV
jgi:hypothetical protein